MRKLIACLFVLAWPASAGAVVVPKVGSCDPKLLLCGQQLNGSLTTSSCVAAGEYFDGYAFPSYQPQAVGIGVVSQGFDSEVAIGDFNDNVLAVGAAPSGQLASAVTYLFDPGIYLGIVTSQPTSASQTGNYTIFLECTGNGTLCSKDQATMCLVQNRFRVQVGWHNQFNDTYGFGDSVVRTDSSGFFTFSDPSNIELLVKVLDFGNGVFKVFYGELTDLQFQIAITDMTNPAAFTKTYTNSLGDCGGIDEDFLQGESDAVRQAARKSAGGCHPSKNTICLLNNRFEMTMTWQNQYNNTSGAGGAAPISDLTGAFYFTDPTDLEVVAKVIDFGNRVAVYYGTLSDLEYDLTVTDTASGTTKVYHNPAGNYCGGLDNSAFPP